MKQNTIQSVANAIWAYCHERDQSLDSDTHCNAIAAMLADAFGKALSDAETHAVILAQVRADARAAVLAGRQLALYLERFGETDKMSQREFTRCIMARRMLGMEKDPKVEA